MSSEEATTRVIDALEAMPISYMLVGSLSSNFYGVPRATHDADFVLQTEAAAIPSFVRQLGPQFRLDPQITFETVTATTRYCLKLADTAFQVELFLLSDDRHDQERFARRRRVHILGRQAFVPTAEDVIVTKLRWSGHGGRARDIDDVRGVVAVQGDRLDWEYTEAWCDRHGTRSVLDEIRRSLPPT